MPTELSVRVTHEGGMRMAATNGVHRVVTDYPLRPGETAEGLKPLELLLASLGACGGSVVALLLTRGRQPVSGVEVEVRGHRRDEHPTVLTSIEMRFIVKGNVEPRVVEAAIADSERRCPVWAMLAPSTPITTSFTVLGGEAADPQGG